MTIRKFAFASAALGAVLLAGCGGSGGSGGDGSGGVSSGKIAYAYGIGGDFDVFVQDPSSGALTAQSPSFNATQPALNRGGTRVAYVRNFGGGVQDLYVQTVNSDASATRLTNTPETEFSPAWGGTDIYFLRSTAAGQDQVFRVPSAGGAAAAITASATAKRGLSVSPDGSLLSFWSTPAGGAPTLVIKRVSDGVENTIFTSTAGADKLFTSWFDGSSLLGSHRRPGEGEGTVFSIRTNGTEFRAILSGFQPRRSGSGQRLMFGRTVGAIDRIFTSTLSGGDVTQYSGGAGTVEGWDWSRD